MAILEWFGIEFDADTDQANKKIDDLSKTTDDYTDKTNKAGLVSNKFGTSLVGLAVKAAGVVGALFSIGAVMGGLSNSIAYADSIGETAEALGLATEELSAWSDAAKMTGGSAEGLQNSVRSLSKDFYQFAATGNSRTEPFFKKLGISMLDANKKARNILDVLPELAEKMEAMSKQDAIGLGQKLGLDQGTIMLLQQGRRGVEELVARQKELGTVSKEDAEVAAAFNDALDDTAHAFRTIYMGIATTILPAFTWFLQKIQAITQWAGEHKVLVVGFFTAVATAITLFYLPSVINAAIATWALAAPILAVIIPLALFAAALALVVEDIYAFLKGGDSLIGQLSKKWPIIGKTIEGIRDTFIWLFESAEKVINFFSDMWNNPKQALEDFKLFLNTVWDNFINSIPGLKTVLDTVIKIFKAALAPIIATIDAVTSSITTAKDLLTGTNSAVDKANAEFNADGGNVVAFTPEQQARWDARQKLQQAQQLTPVVASMGQSVTNNAVANSNRNAVTNNNITINGTNLTQKQLEAAIENSIGNITKTAGSQIDDGVSH